MSPRESTNRSFCARRRVCPHVPAGVRCYRPGSIVATTRSGHDDGDERKLAASAASGAASRINGRVPCCKYIPRLHIHRIGRRRDLDQVSVGTACAVWSMMCCNAGRMAESTAVWFTPAGFHPFCPGMRLVAALARGWCCGTGCGVGSTVVRSDSGVVGATGGSLRIGSVRSTSGCIASVAFSAVLPTSGVASSS